MPQAKKTATPRTPPLPPETHTQPIVGQLCGQDVEVLPVNQWRNSAMRALREGDLDAWADRCLTDDGYEVWEDLDPTFGEISEFFASFGDELATAEVTPPGNRAARRATQRKVKR